MTGIVHSEDDIDIALTKWSNTFFVVVNTFIPRKQISRLFTSYIKKKQRENAKTGKEIGYRRDLGEISRSAQESQDFNQI